MSGGGEGESLEYTTTWIVAISLAAERRLQKIKEELMLLALFSVYCDSPALAECLTVAFPVSRAPEVNRVQRTLVEAWGLIRETFVDPTFNHQDWDLKLQQIMVEMFPLNSADAAYTKISAMLSTFGDPFTRIISPKVLLFISPNMNRANAPFVSILSAGSSLMSDEVSIIELFRQWNFSAIKFVEVCDPCTKQCQLTKVHVIDAKTMSANPIAIIDLPCRVPYGFHALFITETHNCDDLAHFKNPNREVEDDDKMRVKVGREFFRPKSYSGFVDDGGERREEKCVWRLIMEFLANRGGEVDGGQGGRGSGKGKVETR
ncbi:hypothetical protein F8388_001488 [Cannabis sativa]|uniref:Uncharacterized protein n=1 Tax=Cannabis sativa TaxID=3483 RepID=A0A7J6EM20_CANSA|nr:hypothetical protein F8388_001488 [Cannabis sativa]